MKKVTAIVILLLAVLIYVGGCKKPEQNVVIPDPENEVLTTVKLLAINDADSTDKQECKWVKLDPNSTAAPDTNLANMRLKASARYKLYVYFYDETTTPIGNITEEVKEKANYHLVCFDADTTLKTTITKMDLDTNTPALPVGLYNQCNTGVASRGYLQVRLFHQPNVKTGVCGIGTTDADVRFRISIY